MQIDIRCEYCGVEYDYNVNKICPHCGGVPSESHSSKAKKQALSRVQTENHTATAPKSTGKFMYYFIKLIPVWLIIIVLSLVIPPAVRFAISRTAASNLQEIEEIAYTDFCLNEKITAGIYEL